MLRSADSLAEAAAALDRVRTDPAGKPPEPGVESWEATNLHLVARVLVAAARRRTETRGCHWREDHPERDDARLRRHLVVTLRPDAEDRTLDSRGPTPASEPCGTPDSTTPLSTPLSTPSTASGAHRRPVPEAPDTAAEAPARPVDGALVVRTTDATAFPPTAVAAAVVPKEKKS